MAKIERPSHFVCPQCLNYGSDPEKGTCPKCNHPCGMGHHFNTNYYDNCPYCEAAVEHVMES